MEKINFVNGKSPAINGTNLNQIQINVENAIKELYDIFHPVGSYYETSDTTFNPNISWGGTWELEEDGTVLVSRSNVKGSKFNADLGTIVGEEEHQLIIDEIPEHKHDIILFGNTILVNAGSQYGGYIGTGDKATENAGGDKPHNNVQPSKVVNRWHRTA